MNIVRLICGSAAGACLQELQQIPAIACRHLSQVATGSSLSHNIYQLPTIHQSLPEIPGHEIEDGLPEVTAWLRHNSGTNYCSKLRKSGHTPCVLFSLPSNQSVSLTLDNRDAARLVRQYGRNGLQAQVLKLNIHQGPPTSSSRNQQEQQPVTSVRVLTKAVHMNAVSLEVENFRFLFCPPDRQVTVDIPVKVWNADIAPGVKSGGWLHVVNRTVPFLCYGWAIKPYIELDMRNMRVKDVLRFQDVPVPQGCRLKVKDPLQPVVRCAARVGGD